MLYLDLALTIVVIGNAAHFVRQRVARPDGLNIITPEDRQMYRSLRRLARAYTKAGYKPTSKTCANSDTYEQHLRDLWFNYRWEQSHHGYTPGLLNAYRRC